MDDLLSEFLTETNENLAVLDVELVKLEQNPNDPGLLSNIFRLVHTIKGTCGFLGLPRLESVAHAGENVLGKFRDGELHVSPYAVSLILESLDTIKGILSVLEATEAEPPGGDQDLIDRLNAMAEGKEVPKAGAAAAPAPVAAAPENDPEELFTPVPAHLTHTLAPAAPPPPPPPTPAPVAKVEAPAPVVEAAAPPPAPPPPPPPRAEPQEDVRGESKESALAQQTIRVHVDLLENLMTMVSELVLTRNQLLQILRSQKDSEFAAPLQRLNHVTSELQEGVMKTRMQPIGNAWAKLPRLVRDLSHELHKKIELQMLGAETELDRQVLELIKDPLTHMVRNSGDHGLEIPADRVAAGKSETGRITLNAYHEGGHIIIEIADDGRGLALSKIKAKIIQNGLATESELAQMSDQQIQQFIFKPGFSTAAKVTSVSGRGVGMDVVKTNIEKIGGTIEMRSVEGRGTTFTIKIPLTLAIVSALIVECASERFAVPQISVIELVRAASDSEHKIERINGAPVLRLRNRLLPLVSLQNLLKLGVAEDDDKRETFIVVSQVGNYTFGIIVDRVFDTEEIVVKPVAPILRHIELFSGNTILGDGSVIMILDPNGIATASGSMGGTADNAQTAAQEVAKSARREDDKMALLLFSAGEGGPKAVPLSLVARLEDVDLNLVELSNGEPVVQYRGKLMPLVPIDPNWKITRDKRQPVVVFADGDRSMGLVVDEIVDIVEDRLQVELGTERQGFLGSAIIANKATDVIDAGFYLTRAFKDWFGNAHESFEDERQHRVLLVDDSPFFRNLLTPLLTVSGYDVTAVESADEALALSESGEEFDVIVSDIEMPGMSGLDFAQAVRASARWSGTPMVALSSHAAPRDLERGRQAGFNDYVAKFDREALLLTLQQTIAEKGAA
ncbi:hybrid sensor histidine kinase/response regulator [Niveispirillum cyanobacteriorum]|uniref:Chemotaxis protein CheA n=1 Tax=Niveispirillum cyanobacteriorum TaxID=1612173 RepID=A0A2K9N6X4_9PROT|nr:chemotaxis protein CheW [Niveispirillum cyanobacteriorum]AUN28898.1 hybrid sensor histidine kinase/response regulator [Niveispirillum cyanobacteriorum]GGE69401.1 ATPase [Niveispirillum cyanobacteriorum]